MALIQCRTQFIGMVQGVGFRWTTQRIAAGYAVTGWVRNQPDGSVELVAEGETYEVERFLAEIRSRMSQFIRKEHSQNSPAGSNFNGFEVRY